MSNILNLTRADALARLKSISEEIKKTYGVPVVYLKKQGLCHGTYHHSPECNIREIRVGIKGLARPNYAKCYRSSFRQLLPPYESKKDTAKVPDFNFVMALRVLFHERQHIHQELHELQNNDDYGRIMAVQKLARAGEYQYYHRNYACMLPELDAEYHSLLDAKCYLLDNFPVDEEQADMLIVEYENIRSAWDISYLYDIWKEKLFGNYQEIEEAYRKKIKAVLDNTYTTIFPQQTKKRGIVLAGALYSGLKKEVSGEEWQKIYQDIVRANGFERDLKLAKIANRFHPNMVKKSRAMEGMDWTAINCGQLLHG